jgi:hypothetical protein
MGKENYRNQEICIFAVIYDKNFGCSFSHFLREAAKRLKSVSGFLALCPRTKNRLPAFLKLDPYRCSCFYFTRVSLTFLDDLAWAMLLTVLVGIQFFKVLVSVF